MKKLIGSAALAAAVTIAGVAIAADTIRIGSMPVGSGWYVAAAALEQALLREPNYSLAAAMSVVLALFTFVLSFVFLKLTQRRAFA